MQFPRSLRIITGLTAFIFTTTTLCQAAPASVYSIKIPKEYGSVTSRWKPTVKNKKIEDRGQKIDEQNTAAQKAPVILIQDAHTSLEAQKNIAHILKQVKQDYQVGLTGVEGAHNDVFVKDLRACPDKKALEAVMQKLLSKGEINGATYEAITAETESSLYGIENVALYKKNYGAYCVVDTLRNDLIVYLKSLDQCMANTAAKELASESYSLYQSRKAFCEKKGDFVGYFMQLMAVSSRIPDFESTYMQCMLFKEASSLLGAGDSAGVRKEAEIISNRLKKKIACTEENYRAIKNAAGVEGVDLRAFQAFTAYVRYQECISAIDWELLFFEVRMLHYAILMSDSSTTQEKNTVTVLRAYEDFVSLINLEAVRGEVDRFFDGTEDERLTELLEYASMHGVREIAREKILSLLTAVHTYYTVAEERDRALTENLLDKVKATQSDRPSAMVVGGYHTKGITKTLQKNNVPYVVVTPKVETNDTVLPYHDLMRGTVSNLESFISTLSSPAFLNLVDDVIHKENAASDVSLEQAFREKAYALLSNELVSLHKNEAVNVLSAFYQKLFAEGNKDEIAQILASRNLRDRLIALHHYVRMILGVPARAHSKDDEKQLESMVTQAIEQKDKEAIRAQFTRGFVSLSGGGGAGVVPIINLSGLQKEFPTIPLVMIVPADDDGGGTAKICYAYKNFPAMGDSINALASLSFRSPIDSAKSTDDSPYIREIVRYRFNDETKYSSLSEAFLMVCNEVQTKIAGRSESEKNRLQKFIDTMSKAIAVYDGNTGKHPDVTINGQSLGNLLWLAVKESLVGFTEILTDDDLFQIQLTIAQAMSLPNEIAIPSNRNPGTLYGILESITRIDQNKGEHSFPYNKADGEKIPIGKSTGTFGKDDNAVIDAKNGNVFIDFKIAEGSTIEIFHTNKATPLSKKENFKAIVSLQGELFSSIMSCEDRQEEPIPVESQILPIGISGIGSDQDKWGAKIQKIEQNGERLLRIYLDRVGAGTHIKVGGEEVVVHNALVVKQTNITESRHKSKLRKVGFVGASKPIATQFVLDALKNSGMGCVIGPGSPATSLLPLLLLDNVRQELRNLSNKGLPVILVLGATKDNETRDKSFDEFVALINESCGEIVIGQGGIITDIITADDANDDSHILNKIKRLSFDDDYYKSNGQRPAEWPCGLFTLTGNDIENLQKSGIRVHQEDLLSIVSKGVRLAGKEMKIEGVGYDPDRLGAVIHQIILARLSSIKENSKTFAQEARQWFDENDQAFSQALLAIRKKNLPKFINDSDSIGFLRDRFDLLKKANSTTFAQHAPSLMVMNVSNTITNGDAIDSGNGDVVSEEMKKAIQQYVATGGILVLVTGHPFYYIEKYILSWLPEKYWKNIYSISHSGVDIRQGKQPQGVADQRLTIDQAIKNEINRILEIYGLTYGQQLNTSDTTDRFVSLRFAGPGKKDYTSLTEEEIQIINSRISNPKDKIEWHPKGLVGTYDLRDTLIEKFKKSLGESLFIEKKGRRSIDITTIDEVSILETKLSEIIAKHGINESSCYVLMADNALVSLATKEKFQEMERIALPAQYPESLLVDKAILPQSYLKKGEHQSEHTVRILNAAAEALKSGYTRQNDIITLLEKTCVYDEVLLLYAKVYYDKHMQEPVPYEYNKVITEIIHKLDQTSLSVKNKFSADVKKDIQTICRYIDGLSRQDIKSIASHDGSQLLVIKKDQAYDFKGDCVGDTVSVLPLGDILSAPEITTLLSAVQQSGTPKWIYVFNYSGQGTMQQVYIVKIRIFLNSGEIIEYTMDSRHKDKVANVSPIFEILKQVSRKKYEKNQSAKDGYSQAGITYSGSGIAGNRISIATLSPQPAKYMTPLEDKKDGEHSRFLKNGSSIVQSSQRGDKPFSSMDISIPTDNVTFEKMASIGKMGLSGEFAREGDAKLIYGVYIKGEKDIADALYYGPYGVFPTMFEREGEKVKSDTVNTNKLSQRCMNTILIVVVDPIKKYEKAVHETRTYNSNYGVYSSSDISRFHEATINEKIPIDMMDYILVPTHLYPSACRYFPVEKIVKVDSKRQDILMELGETDIELTDLSLISNVLVPDYETELKYICYKQGKPLFCTGIRHIVDDSYFEKTQVNTNLHFGAIDEKNDAHVDLEKAAQGGKEKDDSHSILSLDGSKWSISNKQIVGWPQTQEILAREIFQRVYEIINSSEFTSQQKKELCSIIGDMYDMALPYFKKGMKDSPLHHNVQTLENMMRIVVGEKRDYSFAKNAAALALLHDIGSGYVPAEVGGKKLKKLKSSDLLKTEEDPTLSTTKRQKQLQEQIDIGIKYRRAHMEKGVPFCETIMGRINSRYGDTVYSTADIKAVRDVVLIHDNPTIAEIYDKYGKYIQDKTAVAKGFTENLIPLDNDLAVYLREADRLWMVSQEGLEKDLMDDAQKEYDKDNPQKQYTVDPAKKLAHNSKRFKDEYTLYTKVPGIRQDVLNGFKKGTFIRTETGATLCADYIDAWRARISMSQASNDKNLSRGLVDEQNDTHAALAKAAQEGRMFAVELDDVDTLADLKTDTQWAHLFMSHIAEITSPPVVKKYMLERLKSQEFKNELIFGFMTMKRAYEGIMGHTDKLKRPVRLVIVVEDHSFPTMVFKNPFNNLIAHAGKGEKTKSPYLSIYAGYNSIAYALRSNQEKGFRDLMVHEVHDLKQGMHGSVDPDLEAFYHGVLGLGHVTQSDPLTQQLRAVDTLYLVPELAGLAKSGGVGDVGLEAVNGIEKVWAETGHHIARVVPLFKYANADKKNAKLPINYQQGGWELNIVTNKDGQDIILPIVIDGVTYPTHVLIGKKAGENALNLFLYNETFAEYPYYNYQWDDGRRQGIWMSQAYLDAIQVLQLEAKLLHVNDWQTGLVPAYLKTDTYKTVGEQVKVVATVHNAAYRGDAEQWQFASTGLPASFATDPSCLEFHGRWNMFKGLQLSDALATVSPTHAVEIQTQQSAGHGLQGMFKDLAKEGKFTGFLNGIDYEKWGYKEGENKETYREKLKTEVKKRGKNFEFDPHKPVLTVVSRLATQKGLDLIADLVETLVENDQVQIVVLGTAHKSDKEGMALEERFKAFEKKYPKNVASFIEFNEELSQIVYAAGDFFLMPSDFEPCGIAQMIAMRYGTIPIVRDVGGLNDTIIDYRTDKKKGNGFRFNAPETMNSDRKQLAALFYNEAIKDALACWHDQTNQRAGWHQLVKNAEATDSSWESRVKPVIELYERLIKTLPFYKSKGFDDLESDVFVQKTMFDGMDNYERVRRDNKERSDAAVVILSDQQLMEHKLGLTKEITYHLLHGLENHNTVVIQLTKYTKSEVEDFLERNNVPFVALRSIYYAHEREISAVVAYAKQELSVDDDREISVLVNETGYELIPQKINRVQYSPYVPELITMAFNLSKNKGVLDAALGNTLRLSESGMYAIADAIKVKMTEFVNSRQIRSAA